MKTAVIGLGAGGHARVLIEALRLGTCYRIAGLLDRDPRLHGQPVMGVMVLGDDGALSGMAASDVRHFFVGLGSTRGDGIRQRVFNLGLQSGLEPIRVVHPATIISPSAQIGRGAAILAGAIIGTGARLGDNVIVNTGAIVDHDCVIGDHAHLAPRACLAGGVTVGAGAHVGLGAVVLQGVRIGAGATIGAGAAVLRDVPDGVTVVGVPAKPQTSSSQ